MAGRRSRVARARARAGEGARSPGDKVNPSPPAQDDLAVSRADVEELVPVNIVSHAGSANQIWDSGGLTQASHYYHHSSLSL